jgi:hypothetical protein
LNAPAGAPAAPLEKAVPEPASAEASTPAQADAKAEKPGKPLVVGVQQFDIEGGIVHWQDAATGAAPAALTLAPLVLQAKNLAWPMNAPLQLTATAGLQAAEQARVEGQPGWLWMEKPRTRRASSISSSSRCRCNGCSPI